MTGFIISAYKDTYTILNKHRFKVLMGAIMNFGFTKVYDGIGSINGMTEDVVIVELDEQLEFEQRQLLCDLCTVFEQDHWLYIQNDRVYKYLPTHDTRYLGIYWPDTSYTPQEVRDAIAAGTYTHNKGRGIMYGIDTVEMMADREQEMRKEQKAKDRFSFGTPEWFEGEYAARRNCNYGC